ncbi:MAG TPA: hypothetical protein VG711_07115 [Phycisphaerales bacterium]|nr:hypothetical protein [Phycisphaerales bacterium]
MKQLALVAIMISLSFLTGCGGDTPESISKEMSANMKEMAAILTGVNDEASAKAAVSKINAVREKMRSCRDRAKGLKVDAETEKRIEQNMAKEMSETMTSLAAAQQKLAAHPELMSIIEPALQNMADDL